MRNILISNGIFGLRTSYVTSVCIPNTAMLWESSGCIKLYLFEALSKGEKVSGKISKRWGQSSYLLLIGSCSVLEESGQVALLLPGTEADSLCVALDGLLVLAGLEILVALVLGSLCPVQGALQLGGRERGRTHLRTGMRL